MSTVALSMIIKDEIEEVQRIVSAAYGYFNQIVLVVSDKSAANKLEKEFTKNEDVEVYHRPWNNRFDEARNFALSKVKTDYWFWIDADDVFDFRAIPQLLEVAEEGNYDQLMLPYNYAQDENGNCIAFHWRERLLRTGHPWSWKGWIHETPVTSLPYKAHRVNVPVIHRPKKDHVKESVKRNHEILIEAAAQSDDPRYKLYLGSSYHALGQYGETIAILDKFNKESGSASDIYRSLCLMSECAYLLQRPSAAINYAMQAAALVPQDPQAYWLLAQWESDQNNNHEAIEWIKVAETKPDPDGMVAYDPTQRQRAWLTAAKCEFILHNYNEAYKWLKKLPENHPDRQDLEIGFRNEANAEVFLKLLPKFLPYFESEESLYNALCHDIKYDQRIRGLRSRVVKPKKWGDKSIVFLVGEGYEEWGPHTLDKGMGGSEEAIIYLSRELAKKGWQVTIYGAVDEAIDDHVDGPTISYLPWQELNRDDEFNVFVGWRAPEFCDHIKAKVKIVDVHDKLDEDAIKDWDDVTYFVKSNYHRNLYPKLADNKFRVIGNGILKGQFK